MINTTIARPIKKGFTELSNYCSISVIVFFKTTRPIKRNYNKILYKGIIKRNFRKKMKEGNFILKFKILLKIKKKKISPKKEKDKDFLEVVTRGRETTNKSSLII